MNIPRKVNGKLDMEKGKQIKFPTHNFLTLSDDSGTLDVEDNLNQTDSILSDVFSWLDDSRESAYNNNSLLISFVEVVEIKLSNLSSSLGINSILLTQLLIHRMCG